MTERGTLEAAIRRGLDGPQLPPAEAPELLPRLATQLAALGDHGQRSARRATNQALVFVSEMKPRDPAELLLLAQMAAVHQATMMLARRLNHVETHPQQDAAERAP